MIGRARDFTDRSGDSVHAEYAGFTRRPPLVLPESPPVGPMPILATNAGPSAKAQNPNLPKRIRTNGERSGREDRYLQILPDGCGSSKHPQLGAEGRSLV